MAPAKGLSRKKTSSGSKTKQSLKPKPATKSGTKWTTNPWTIGQKRKAPPPSEDKDQDDSGSEEDEVLPTPKPWKQPAKRAQTSRGTASDVEEVLEPEAILPKIVNDVERSKSDTDDSDSRINLLSIGVCGTYSRLKH